MVARAVVVDDLAAAGHGCGRGCGLLLWRLWSP
jgi:hypothetical protein